MPASAALEGSAQEGEVYVQRMSVYGVYAEERMAESHQ